MARGYPVVWSTLVGGLVGAVGQVARTDTAVPEQIGLVGIGLGGVIVLMGLFVQLRAPGKPTTRINPEEAQTYHPTQRYAFAKISVGLLAACVGGYSLFKTELPYLYPGLVFLFGTVQLGSGLHRYWANSLTTYYIDSTEQTFLKEYRFIGRKTLPARSDAIDQIPTRQGRIERLLGIGQARIILRNTKITVRDLPDVDQFREDIQPLLPD